jgi:hypothetical protein
MFIGQTSILDKSFTSITQKRPAAAPGAQVLMLIKSCARPGQCRAKCGPDNGWSIFAVPRLFLRTVVSPERNMSPSTAAEPGSLEQPANNNTPSPHANGLHLPLFKSGARVSYEGKPYTVSHVIVSRSKLMVHLQETGNWVYSEKLTVEPTWLELRRN